MLPVITGGDSLTVVLAGAIATTNPTWSVDSVDLNTGAKSNVVGSTNGVTAVELLGSTTPHQATSISIFNIDTAAVTVTVKKVQAGVGFTLTKAVLAVGSTLTISEDGVEVVDDHGQITTNAVTTELDLIDDADVEFGTGNDAAMRWSTGDASNHALVVGLGDTNQSLHITDKAAIATDWNIAATTHPNLYVHSNTTPATDYIRVGSHDGTTADIDIVGGTTLNLQIAGTTEVLITGSILDLASTNLQMQDAGQILDNSGNELIKFPSAVASAINEITVTNAAAAGDPQLSATGGDTDINVKLTPKGAGYIKSDGPFQVEDSVAVTATTGGATTGLIPVGSTNVVVTSDSVDKQISLPAAVVGHEMWILVGATGCELISAVAAHKVNNVTVGATNEAALTATNLYWCKYVATNTWIVVGYTNLGAVQAALVPDSL